MERKFGWKPDVPDHRDLILSVPRPRALASKVDLRPGCPPVYDQGSLGSCTANAVGGALQFTEKEQHGGAQRPVPSRLFIYYNTRVIERTVGEDSGATLRDTMKSINRNGYCREATWPYKIDQFKKKPARAAYTEADKHKLATIQYARVAQTADALRTVLAGSDPIVFGFAVYESFDKAAKTGVCPMPSKNEDMVGGHAVLLVGYDHEKRQFLVRNSWGAKWGQSGYFWMPYEYVLNGNLADDFWCVKAVPQAD